MNHVHFSSNSPYWVGWNPAIKEAPGRLILVSGPSGSGKGTVINKMREDELVLEKLGRIQSITTRAPRPGEEATGQYNFVSKDEFLRMKDQNQLFNSALIDEHHYGSSMEQVVNELSQGRNVLFELAAPAALEIKKKYDNAATVFINPPGFSPLWTLFKRLKGRGTNSLMSILRRLNLARGELRLKPQFDHVITNHTGKVDEAANELRSIVMGDASETEQIPAKEPRFGHKRFAKTA